MIKQRKIKLTQGGIHIDELNIGVTNITKNEYLY